MNKPRVLIRIAGARPLRSEQTVTCPFQLVPGAVLLSAPSVTQQQTCLARLDDYCGFLVKNVGISLCDLVCTKVFTLSPFKVLKERNIRSRNFKSSGRKSTKTGGSDPAFSAFGRPKSFVGPLPPVLSATQKHTTNREFRARQSAEPQVKR